MVQQHHILYNNAYTMVELKIGIHLDLAKPYLILSC